LVGAGEHKSRAQRCPQSILRLAGEEVDGGGAKGLYELPSDWAAECFAVVDAGNGRIALHDSLHNCFLRLADTSVDARGGVKNVDQLPPEAEWRAERFLIRDWRLCVKTQHSNSSLPLTHKYKELCRHTYTVFPPCIFTHEISLSWYSSLPETHV
jgi:hypothetical protein